MLLVAGAAIWSVQRLQDTFFWVDHNHGILNRLESVLTDVLSMQTSVRGFVLTGDDSMLRPYDTGAAGMPVLFAELKVLFADQPAQLERLQRAREAADGAQQIMQGRIAARRERGLDAAAETPQFLRGQVAVQTFRSLVEEMKADGRRQLDERFGNTRKAAGTTMVIIIGASLFAVALTGLASWIVRRDFSRRREAETERDQFFNLTRDMVCIASFDGSFNRLNPAWQATLGFSVEELLARPFVDFVHADDRERTLAENARLLRGEETIGFENRYRCRDGSFRWLSWSARPVLSKKMIIATARDVTEQKEAFDRIGQLNTALTTRAEELEAVNRELESFSYSISHDLRAPLRHIDSFAGLLAKRGEKTLDTESRGFLSAISRAAKQMGVLIDDLLTFSRMGRVPLRPHKVDQNELVAGVLADGYQVQGERCILWEIGPLPSVHADSTLLRQVWANLIDNAVKYSRKTAQPRIEIGGSIDQARKEYVFFVRDNGVGFDMTYADKLFGVFQRLHNPLDFEGTGIGLANVRRIVTRHGGRAWAEGKVNAGATFYFSLPIDPPLPKSGSRTPFKTAGP